MQFHRFARVIPIAVMIITLTIYLPTLFQIFEEFGFWRLFPLWGCALFGFIAILMWIEDWIAIKRVSPEVYNANFPKPSVRASSWDESLTASEASVSEAFETTKGRRDGVFGIVCANGDDVLVRWTKKGWYIDLTPRGEPIRKIAVKANSDWAGKEVTAGRRIDTLFKRYPIDWFEQEAAKDIVRSMLGWIEMPPHVAWSTVRYV